SCTLARLPVRYSLCMTIPSPPQIYPLSLHDALPISGPGKRSRLLGETTDAAVQGRPQADPDLRILPAQGLRLPGGRADHRLGPQDRKSTRLNSSHQIISYAVFCLKKKTQQVKTKRRQ